MIASAFEPLLGKDGPLAVSAYDGSVAGNPDAPLRLELTSPEAVSYLVSAPGELGLARAYVTGHLKITGGIYETLEALLPIVEGLSLRDGARLLRDLGPAHLRKVTPPSEELPGRARRALVGLRHSRSRDSLSIERHYDVSNDFYEMVLGPSMAYTCACYPTADASLEQAQFAKFDLVCAKLGLRPGMRLLDVGCGWGAMAIHAAKHYDVDVLGVTLSREQASWARKEVAAQGLTDKVEIRHLDYRDVTESGFDAVSSIGLTEHIGAKNLPSYFTFLAERLRQGGRLLNHSITRAQTAKRHRVGPFIDRYVFPDGELEGVGEIASAMQDNGFEVRHGENLREHYALTLAAWCRNLDANWDAAVAEAGLRRARVWALYMAASQLAFDRHQLELHQLLGVKVTDSGDSGMPLRPTW